MAMHKVLLPHHLHDTGGSVCSATGLLFFLTATLALGPTLSARPAVADIAGDSDLRSRADPPHPLPGSAPSSSSLPEQIAALKKEQLELAQKLVAEFPKEETALVLMGNVLQFQGRGEEAGDFWGRALQVNPQRADVYLSLGQRAMLRGSYEEAAADWRKVLEIDPRMPGVRASLGLALMGLGRHQEAVEMLEKGLLIGTASSADHFVLGQAYLQTGQLEKARASHETAVRLQPDHTNAHYGLFTVYSRLGEQDKAQEHLALFRKLKAQEMKTLKDRNDAYDDLQAVRSHVAETYVGACLLCRDPQHAAQVEQMLRRALEIDSSNVEALRSLGDFYQSAGRGAEAEKVCRALIEAAPHRSDGYRELALLYLRRRTRLPEARQLAEKAVALEPVAANYFVLSRAYDQNGDAARALSAMKQAADLEPANASYRQMYEYLRARELKQ